MQPEKLISVKELAERLEVSSQFIYNISSPRMPSHRRLPSIKIGRLRRFNYADVVEYFKRQSGD
jgi:excisionase family DNA binding protein